MEASVRTFEMQGAFAPRKNTTSLAVPRTDAGFQVVLISTTVIFVVAATSGLLSPPRRGIIILDDATYRTRNSFSHIHTRLTEMELPSLRLYQLDYQEYVAPNLALPILHYVFPKQLRCSNAVGFIYHVSPNIIFV